MNKKKLLDQIMAEEGEKPVEMVAPQADGILNRVLGKSPKQPEVVYPEYDEPYKVDQDLRKQGFQVPVEKRLLFERIARMLGR